MPIYRLLEGHLAFKREFERNREFLTRLARLGQSPRVLWFGCSDSRVIPEVVMGAEPGDLLVMRNVANIIPPAGSSGDVAGSLIELAVRRLNVHHIVVCGHSECAGVAALEGEVDPDHEPHLAGWLELARPALDRLSPSVEEQGISRLNSLVQANVLLQCEHLFTYPCVEDAVGKNEIRVHPWFYDMNTGDLLAHHEPTGGWHAVVSQDDETA